MRREAKLTSKGQITIPRDIRRVLDLHEGDVVAFETDDDGVHIVAHESASPIDEYVGIWREGEGLTLEEVNAQIRALRDSDE